MLTRDSYTVDCADSLFEADQKLTQHLEIVLLDNLPDGEGLEYLKKNISSFSGV